MPGSDVVSVGVLLAAGAIFMVWACVHVAAQDREWYEVREAEAFIAALHAEPPRAPRDPAEVIVDLTGMVDRVGDFTRREIARERGELRELRWQSTMLRRADDVQRHAEEPR